MKEIPQPNMHLFDCRNYIFAGDTINYMSYKACSRVDDVQRLNAIPYEAMVINVYEKFVEVLLKKQTELVSRWNIEKVNGVPLGNKNGYFGNNFKRRFNV